MNLRFTIYDLRLALRTERCADCFQRAIRNPQSAICRVVAFAHYYANEIELNNSSSTATGRRYWRSLDELGDTPEFKQWLEREFPQGASEFTDPVSRRHFVKIMSASFALAGLGVMGAGCRRPEEKLEPFGQQPEGYVYGEPKYYATAMPTRTGAIPLVAKSYEGRPIKLEGNAKFPGSNGGTDRYAQASILDLYDPDRAKRVHDRTATPFHATKR